ncbi:hypothetical protein PM10SUCC1_19660 [Propionigenium maris DSM 9537]|uniref:EF-hand domain-containing protein n=1 Tax=Propionigenium maris DSM 9537 TaxID=1123000 RepID=A0A9W6GLI6_9FUSO|nr:DUF1007 family protein [Propionigenium maris]GLI56452.1 hypothetical protein PM10SUCC1_19660 [Propionigenium maris DSM 9537]
MRTVIIFLLLSTLTLTHPHVFMEAVIRIDTEGEELRGIEYEINMDEMNSLVFINQYDKDGDGTLNLEEGKRFIEETFYGYKGAKNHFKVRYKGKDIDTKPVLRDIYVEDFYLTFIFYVPLEERYTRGDILDIALYDPDYFYDYYYDEYTIEGKAGNLSYDYRLEENRKVKYYMGTMHPMEYEVKF